MRNRTLVLIATLLAVGAWAEQESNPAATPLAVSSASGTVTFSSPQNSVHFTNDGPNSAIIRVFVSCETIATITTANAKARLIKINEGWGLDIGPRDLPTTCATPAGGVGFIGFAHVAAAAETASVRWFAK